MSMLTEAQVYEAISVERQNQKDKWGDPREQSLPGFLLVVQAELNEAIYGWIKNLPGKSAPLNELVQVAAVCVAALEKYGTTGNTKSTDDLPRPQTQPVQKPLPFPFDLTVSLALGLGE